MTKRKENKSRARVEGQAEALGAQVVRVDSAGLDVLGRPVPRWRVGTADVTGLIPIIDENGRACAFVPALYADAGKVAERIASAPALVRKLEAIRRSLAQLTDTSNGWPKAAREAAQQVLDDHLTGDL